MASCSVYLSFNWSSVPGVGCTMNCNDDIDRCCCCGPEKTVRRHTSTRTPHRFAIPMAVRTRNTRATIERSSIDSLEKRKLYCNDTTDAHTRTPPHSMNEICYRHFWWWSRSAGRDRHEAHKWRWGRHRQLQHTPCRRQAASGSWSPMITIDTTSTSCDQNHVWYDVFSTKRTT